MELRGLVWDDEDDPEGNIQHIARHRVRPWEVREVLESAPVFREAEESYGPNPVYVAIGFTAAGRLLEVWGIHFRHGPLAGWWRTITAMDARRRYRRIYLDERGGR